MIKFELIEVLVWCQIYFVFGDVELVVKSVIEQMSYVLFNGECIEVCGFGSFVLYYCLLCMGCNFKIGEVVVFFGKYVLYFKFGKELCEWVNQ